MKNTWKATAAGLAVLIGLSGAAFGADRNHDRDDHDRDRGRVEQQWHNDRRDADRAYNNSWNRDRDGDRRVYNNGWYGDRDHDGDRRVYNNGYSPYYGNSGYYRQPYYNGYYGNSGYYASNAQQIGYQDGLNDGRNDRITGHSFRPTHDDNFKNADRGYSGAFGNKQAYKDTYRQGYEQGYQQGYGR